MQELRVPTDSIMENPCITLQSAFNIHGSASTDSTNYTSCSNMVRIYCKYLSVSGPACFKLVLFKGQYVYVYSHFSCVWLFAAAWTIAGLLFCPWDFPRRILECVAVSSSRGSSWPRDQIGVFCIFYTAGGFFAASLWGKSQIYVLVYIYIYMYEEMCQDLWRKDGIKAIIVGWEWLKIKQKSTKKSSESWKRNMNWKRFSSIS